MSTYSFFATVHLDRFSDLALVVGDNMVVIEPFSVGEDGTVQVHIRGESGLVRSLDRSLQRIKHILLTAPIVEEV